MTEKRKARIPVTRILVSLFLIVMVLQFMRPPLNRSAGESSNAIHTRYPVPPEVDALLRHSCFDCHSNNTVYPWYFHVEPVGWFLNGHITDGKQALNFDEFAAYPPWRQIRKFQAIRQEVEEGNMPLPSYTLIHVSSILTPDEKGEIVHWVEAMVDTMKARYPADSLKRPQRGH
jgi:hypothetical protein